MSIDIFVTTWPTHPCRVDYLWRTLESLKKYLVAPEEGVEIFVSSESEIKGQWHGDRLREVCDVFRVPLVWRPGPANLGAHLNFGFDRCRGDIFFYCQDDFELKRPLDLTPAIELLRSDESVAMVRYYTIYATSSGEGPWRDVDQTDRLGNWSYGDNPCIAHRRWFQRAGRYVEGGDCGVHETTMIAQLRRSGLRIVVPSEMADLNDRQEANYYFEHIGSKFVNGVSAFEEKR